MSQRRYYKKPDDLGTLHTVRGKKNRYKKTIPGVRPNANPYPNAQSFSRQHYRNSIAP